MKAQIYIEKSEKYFKLSKQIKIFLFYCRF